MAQDSLGKISIVMPVRDGQDRITRRVSDVITGLQKLGIDDWELVIVDDGSSDGTAAVLDVITSSCDRIRIARHSRPRDGSGRANRT